MKKFYLVLFVLSFLPFQVFADAGDTLDDMYNAMWLIAAQTNMLDNLLTNMNAMPEAYQATVSQTEWATWLKLKIQLDLTRLFPTQVYTELLNRVIGYNYGNARFADEYAPPDCTVNGTNIECDEDPTGAARTPVLYRRVALVFTEQAVSASFSVDTWTFSSVPANSNYVIAWSDNFASLPTEYITVSE